MNKESKFPGVFWVTNIIEVLERFAYYGIYFGFAIYLGELGYTKADLGIIQSIFLLFSYGIPIISGTLADRIGFKKLLIISYLAYLPSILLLMITKSFSGIALTMLAIGFAAGTFKPLAAGTIRAVTTKSNKTLGFGIFYVMVNIGGSFGPIVAGKLRILSWNYVFLASAISIGVMLFITLFFYKEPEREIKKGSLKKKFNDIVVAFSDWKFTLFITLLGIFYWLPFWAFFNLCALYIENNIDTIKLYINVKSVLGVSLASLFSGKEDGVFLSVTRILPETIAHTGYLIIIFQLLVSKTIEKFNAIPVFIAGVISIIAGFLILAYAQIIPSVIFLGILMFAFGEMISSPRIQEYITWIAPKEKAGLYMGLNFISMLIGAAFSGITYTTLYGYFQEANISHYIWYTLSIHMLLGIFIILCFVKVAGDFKEKEE